MEGESLTLKTLEGKFKKLQKLSENTTLVTANMTALYPSISHEDGLETLRKRLVVSEDFQLVNDFTLNSLKVKNSTVIISNSSKYWRIEMYFLGCYAKIFLH